MKTKIIITIATIVATLACMWNLMGEYYVIRNIWDALILCVAWLAVPWLNGLIGVAAKEGWLADAALLTSIICALFYTYYALNGSTKDHGGGAEHLHLILVPFIVPIISIGLYGVVFIRRKLGTQR